MKILQEPVCTAMERLWLERDLEDNCSCDFLNKKVSCLIQREIDTKKIKFQGEPQESEPDTECCHLIVLIHGIASLHEDILKSRWLDGIFPSNRYGIHFSGVPTVQMG